MMVLGEWLCNYIHSPHFLEGFGTFPSFRIHKLFLGMIPPFIPILLAQTILPSTPVNVWIDDAELKNTDTGPKSLQLPYHENKLAINRHVINIMEESLFKLPMFWSQSLVPPYPAHPAYVHCESNVLAAARALRVGSQPDFRLGNLHPAVQWAEEEPEIDPRELAKVKVAFVRNLPTDAEEKYLSQLFNPYGEVEKVVVSKKGSSSVGFVHFTNRLDLDRAVSELNGKTVRGPRGGQVHVLQVEVARPMDKSKKRVRENSDSSAQDHSKVLISNIHNSHISRELEPADPYEDAVIALPLAVKERLLRILRLGIATRFDIDVRSLCSLKELPEPIAISVLDQFMISGSASQNKSAYLAAVISKHLVDKVGPDQSLVSLLRVEDTTRNEHKLLNNFSHQLSSPVVSSFTSHADSATARSDIYAPHHSALFPDYSLSNRTMIGRVDERGSLLSSRSLFGSESAPIPRTVQLEEGSNSRFEAAPPHSSYSTLSYGRVGLKTEERPLSPPPVAPSSSAASYARLGPGLSSGVRAVAGQQASRPQIRFDPFTGEPYKFDPFTGEPIIHPGNSNRQF